MRDGTISFNTADFWKQFAQREWQPRATQSAANLVGPFRMYGHCLDPVAIPDELHWYDPSTPAQDEDIVLVQWDPAELQKIYERNADNGDWIRQYGPPCPIATKVYKTIGSSQWLLTRKSMVRLGNNKILGVLRKVMRPECADEQCIAASLIEPNAATEVSVTTEPADGNQAYASVTQPVLGVTGLNGLASYTSPDYTATQVDVSWSAQARISNTTSGVAVGEARLQARCHINGVEVFSKRLILESYTGADSWGPFSVTRSFSVPAGQTIDARIQTSRSFSTGGTSPAQTMYWRDALVNIVASKR